MVVSGLMVIALLGGAAPIAPGVDEELERLGGVEIVVLLRPGVGPEGIDALVDGGGFSDVRRFTALPGFSAHVTAAALARLGADARVASVEADQIGHALTLESAEVTGAARVGWELGVTGRGVGVAVLDTGIDRGHPDLDAGGLLAEKCFVRAGCPLSDGGVGDAAPEGSGHGTHVAGIITGDGTVAPRGLAPGAGVVAIRVFDSQSVGHVSDWAAGLDWVLSQHRALGIRVVNLSFGTDAHFSGVCDAQQPVLTAAIERLRVAGIIVFAASGNEFRGDAMVAPACVGAAVAVGATYDGDLGREPDTGAYSGGCSDGATDAGTVVCFSNSGEALDLLAPGSRIRAAAPGSRMAERRGTSQAAPHAAAIAALMFERDARLTPDDVERILKTTGSLRVDAKNQLARPLVDAYAAVTEVTRTFCARRSNLEACELEFPCDGGECRQGSCFDGVCVTVLPRVGDLPRAPGGAGASGCASVGLVGLEGALVLWIGLRLRLRGAFRAGSGSRRGGRAGGGRSPSA
jgi:subtilisin family serine protease